MDEDDRAELSQTGDESLSASELEQMPFAASVPVADSSGRWRLSVLFVSRAAPKEGLTCRSESEQLSLAG